MVEEQVLLFSNESVVNADSIACETRKDPVLKQVLQFTKHEWPSDVSAQLLPYYRKRFELTVQNGVLLWDSRVLVPMSLQDDVLGNFVPTYYQSVNIAGSGKYLRMQDLLADFNQPTVMDVKMGIG